MEAMDFSNWPAWLILTVLALNLFKAPLSKAFPAMFGILTRTSEDKVEAAKHAREQEIKAIEYERMNKSFHQDKTFELFEDTLTFLREDRKASREDAQNQLEQNREMFKAITRLTATVEQLAGVTRILSQNSAKHDDRLGDISQGTTRTDDRIRRIEQQIDKAVKE